MEKLYNLVSWSSPSTSENLSLKLNPLPFNTKYCVSVEDKAYILSDINEVYSLNPNPTKFNLSIQITNIACNISVVLMIDNNGKVLVQGDDILECGILGIQGQVSISEPTLIPSFSTTFAVSCSLGPEHAALIDNEGKLYTWGSNKSGQIGKKNSNPTIVTSASIFWAKKVLCGKTCTVFSTGGGHLYTFGKIGKNSGCPIGVVKQRDPSIVPEMEYHFTSDFTVGYNFVAALTSTGEVFLYDDCEIIIKIPMYQKVKAISCCQDTIYCIEKDTFYLYEWRFGSADPNDCDLRTLYGKAYKMGKTNIFDSNGKTMYATVSKETAGRFLFNVNHELILAVPKKTTYSPEQSPGIKRTSFRDLSKEFSLNIDHSIVIKNDAAERIANLLIKVQDKIFHNIRKSAYMEYMYKKAIKKNKATSSIVWKLNRIVIESLSETWNKIKTKFQKSPIKNEEQLKSSFDNLAKHYKAPLSLKVMTLNLEKLFKTKVFHILKNHKKFQVSPNMKCGILVITGTLRKLFLKKQASIFTLLLRECMSKNPAKNSIKSVNNYLAQRLEYRKTKYAHRPQKSQDKAISLVKFCIVFQSIFEKHRTSCLLKGMKGFRIFFRGLSCFTPSLNSIRTDQLFAESFDKGFNFSGYVVNESYQGRMIPNRDRKKLSLGIPERHLQEIHVKDIKAETDRRHNMHLNLAEIYSKTRRELKKPNDLRKAYDSKLKNMKMQNIREKRNNKGKGPDLYKLRQEKLIKAIIAEEYKFFRIMRIRELEVVHLIVSQSFGDKLKIEAWKVKIFALGLHKFTLTAKKILKQVFCRLKMRSVRKKR
ncbi:hypothetical protein SteCoe_1613 [Stentor coeruleus]|uniref:Uncharacterized protein n=1 Tax=Stentor coeruleus TaxID=5963 RepID=A0A1R2D1D4_9CILI|nr:hypothetical protein SteCoe_1613 [Stentor coeruleus]